MKNLEGAFRESLRTLRREWRALRRRRAPWVTGLDLDGGKVFVVQVSESGGAKKLRRAAEVRLRDPETGEISDEIRDLVRRWKVEKGRIVTFVPRNRIAVQSLSLPTSDVEQLHRLAPFEAARLLPYPPEELLADIEISRVRDDGGCEAVLFAARDREVEEYISLLESLGLEPDRIEVSTTALARVVEPAEDETVAVCHFGESRADMVLLAGSDVVFTRGIDLSEPGGGDDTIADEIVRSFRYGTRGDGSQDLENLALLVTHDPEGSVTGRLREMFPEEKEWSCNGFHAEDVSEDLGPYAPAIGAALEPAGTPNLLPASLVERRRLRDRIRSGVWLVLLACGFLALSILLADRYLGSLENRLAQKTAELRTISEDARELRMIQRRSEAIAEHINPAGDPLEVLVELYRVVPSGVVLNHLQVTGDGLVVKGQAATFPEVWTTVEALSGSPLLRDVQVQFATSHSVKGTEVVDFSVEAALTKERGH